MGLPYQSSSTSFIRFRCCHSSREMEVPFRLHPFKGFFWRISRRRRPRVSRYFATDRRLDRTTRARWRPLPYCATVRQADNAQMRLIPTPLLMSNTIIIQQQLCFFRQFHCAFECGGRCHRFHRPDVPKGVSTCLFQV